MGHSRYVWVPLQYDQFTRNPMTTAFIDYAAEAQARQNIEDSILRYTQSLCEALKQNYIDHSIFTHQVQLIKYGGDRCDVSYASFHEEEIIKLKQGICDYEFIIETGRKYHKIIMNANGSRSAHAFVDRKTGGVFKTASWRSPAKGERYNLLLIKDREWLLKNADWASSYLYKR